jgi:hypothetical protein
MEKEFLKTTTCKVCKNIINLTHQNFFNCHNCKNNFHYYCLFKSDSDKFDKNSKEIKCILCSIKKINPFIKNIATYNSPLILKWEKSRKKYIMNFDVKHETKIKAKADKSFSFLLYSIKISKKFKNCEEILWPIDISILLNGKKLSNLVSGQAYNISQHIEVSNTLEINHFEESDLKYMILVVGGYNILPSEVVLKENQLSVQEYKTRQCRLFEENMIREEKITVKDVMTQKIIKTPVRSEYCSHFQCFDFQTYLQICFLKKTCVCPICKRLATFSDLFEDLFFKKLINEFVSNYDYENMELYLKHDGNNIIKIR